MADPFTSIPSPFAPGGYGAEAAPQPGGVFGPDIMPRPGLSQPMLGMAEAGPWWLAPLLGALAGRRPRQRAGDLPPFMAPSANPVPPGQATPGLGAVRPSMDAQGPINRVRPEDMSPDAPSLGNFSPGMSQARRRGWGTTADTSHEGGGPATTVSTRTKGSDRSSPVGDMIPHPSEPNMFQMRDRQGKVIAEVEAVQNGNRIEVVHVGAIDPATGQSLGPVAGRNVLGPGMTRAMLTELRRRFPGASEIGGDRVSGARRTAGGRTTTSVTQPLRPETPPTDRSLSAVPGGGEGGRAPWE